MLHILRSGPDRETKTLIEAMFVARRRVFVDLLQWDVPVVDGRYEIDQYDDEHALYLILTDRDGRHLGSARLLPSERPHILGDLFPALCDGPVPRDAATFEVTRFCLDRDLTARARRDVRDTLVVALVTHALAMGIERYTAIAATSWARQILAFGWECRPLGAPQAVDGEMLAVFEIAIDASTPGLLARAGIRDRLSATPDTHAA